MKNQIGHRNSCLVWGGRLFLGFVVVMALLLAVGYMYQLRITATDFERYPATGQRVDVGGYSLHIDCRGQGSPTVVVDAGNGDFSLSWQGIQAETVQFTRVCTYDRAGYGWSDPSPNPRTAGVMAGELHMLLANAGVGPPYVLVGHSLGGYTVRMYADLYPDEVVGMILVDAGHEDQLERFPPEFEKLERQTASYFAGGGFLARFGILRLIGGSSGGLDQAPPYVFKMPADAQLMYMAMLSHPSYFDAALAERRALAETGDQVRAAGGLGDMPLIVLTAENTVDPATLGAIGMPVDFDASAIQAIWFDLQAELAALSTNSEHLLVEDSTHAVHLDQPGVVIDAIRRVVEMARVE